MMTMYINYIKYLTMFKNKLKMRKEALKDSINKINKIHETLLNSNTTNNLFFLFTGF